MKRRLMILREVARGISPQQWRVVCTLWASLALMLVAYNVTNNYLSNGAKDLGFGYLCRQVLPVALYILCWALTFPVSLWVARVVSGLARLDWPFIAFQAIACFALVAVTGAIRGVVIGAFYYDQYGLLKPGDIGNYALSYAYTGFMCYAVSLILGYASEYYRMFRDKELRASQLETQLIQSQLQTLRAQLQPHFLFNTMNAIITLMRKGDTAAAIRMINRLSDLLRQSLDTMAAQEVRLADELALLRKYLDIQQMRFGDRLRVVYDVSPDTENLLVPNLILQPLTENAVRHGIGRTTKPGTITVASSVRADRLRISVSDTGPGVIGEWRGKPGIGIPNTVARLAKLYGADYQFELANGPDHGATVALEVPARPCRPDAEG